MTSPQEKKLTYVEVLMHGNLHIFQLYRNSSIVSDVSSNAVESINFQNFKDTFCYIIFVEIVSELYYVYYNNIHKKKPVHFHHFLFIGKGKFKTKRHVKANYSKQKDTRKQLRIIELNQLVLSFS